MDPFATLGLPRRYEIDHTELEARYRELQRALHPDRHASSGASVRSMSVRRAVEVNDAYRALKDDLRRAEALLALQTEGAASAQAPEDPAFLMEMLELREQLELARDRGDSAGVQRLSREVEAMQDGAREELRRAFGALSESGRDPGQLAAVQRALGRLKYFRRFLDEVNAAEDAGEGAA